MGMLRRLFGAGVLATAMMLPAAMGQRSGHHGNGSLAHHVSERPSGGGTGGGGIGVGGCVGGWGLDPGCPITPRAYRVGSSPSCPPCYPWGQADSCP